ncbi:division/cell wall cluster transcriptional repressor MraZ [Chryseolinea sp. H1M3-3]|uniref:division/cell wall cluster transcriptional repressor MraZ n=1 Tax=Chryseolinea sp. H1M3-3 TaxID=3034144 RepID=UPI0023ECA59B|nr:division/cell wall cluster transcriptional repressor MraZ [Chryseolinea sp. H1M3-3]
MTFFTGRYDSKLDSKGRLVLPSKFKAQLPGEEGHELVIQMGFEPHLNIYPMLEFKKVMSKVSGLSDFNEENRQLQLNFFSSITMVELDDNGRFLIPKNMLSYAQLQKDVIFIGMGTKIVLWDPATYEKHLIRDQREYSKLAEKHLDK